MLLRRIAVLLAIALVLSALGTANVDAKKPTPPPPDTTPPDAVTNLSVESSTHQSITLSWTATGDDGSEGQASTYDIRYALDGQMTEVKWDADPLNRAWALKDPYAVPHPDLLVYPAASGATETVEFVGLAADTDYYFGIKACDEAGNCSEVAASYGQRTDEAQPGQYAIDIVDEDAWVDYGHRKDVDVLDDGQIGVWYADDGDFYHSYRDPDDLEWYQDVFAGGEDDGCHSFAYSPSGVPWASTCVNGELEVVHPNPDVPGELIYEQLDGGDANAVLMDHDPVTGEPALAFRRPDVGQLLYAWRETDGQNVSWNVEVLESSLAICNPRLAFHPTGQYPTIAYAVVWSDVVQIRFMQRDGVGESPWSDFEVVHHGDSGLVGALFLAYDPITGYPAIVHMGYYDEGLHYTYRTDLGTWSEPEYIDAVDDSDTGWYDYKYGDVVMAFGADGTRYVGYIGAGAYKSFRLLADDGTGWQLVQTDPVIPVIGEAMLRDDPAVNPDNGMPVFTFGLDPVRIIERIPPDPGVSVGPTEGLVTTEAGNGTDTFAVRLDTEPDANVTVYLSSSDTTEGTVDPTSLTFTAANWNLVQVVTVTGLDDGDADGDQFYDVAIETDSDDEYYDNLTVNIEVTNLDDDVMHVGDLDGVSINLGATWQAEVTAWIHDADHGPIGGATVSGEWTGGVTGSCTTDSDGTCTVTSPEVKKNKPSVTFAVENVTHDGFGYDAASNHDPDGDSDGTTITVDKQ